MTLLLDDGAVVLVAGAATGHIAHLVSDLPVNRYLFWSGITNQPLTAERAAVVGGGPALLVGHNQLTSGAWEI